MARGGAYLIAFVIGLAILLTWAIVEIVRREGDDEGDPREIPEGDSDLQRALNAARPGDVINIDEGIYRISLTTAVDGTEDQPITLRGRPGTDPERVILMGEDDKGRVLEIIHSYYVIEDFTIDGEVEEGEEYREHLIFVEGSIEPSEVNGIKSSVDGTVIRNMNIRNAGEECIHLRYYVTNSVIYDNRIENCGIYQFVLGGSGKTGEGVYIGTAEDQWDDKNGDEDVDVCYGNVVMDNYINTQGNEGVEVKEGSEYNIIQFNEIFGQMDEDSGGIGIRGNNNIVRYNTVVEAVGACVRLGGEEADGVRYGIDNEVYQNSLLRCQNSAIKIVEDPQIVCENTVEEPDDTDDQYSVVRGDASSGYEADAECPTNLSPAPVPPTPTPPITTTSTSDEDRSSEDIDDDGGMSGDEDEDEDEQELGYETYTYLGCYADNEQNQVLDYNFEDPQDMTVQLCVNACLRDDANYAGLQLGSECWCGTGSVDYDLYGAGLCNYDCAGDATSTCGGDNSLSVFAITGDPTTDGVTDDATDDGGDDGSSTSTSATVASSNTADDADDASPTTSGGTATSATVGTYPVSDAIFLGCFVDQASDHVLDEGYESSDMTYKACFSFCDDNDAEIAGLGDGDVCYCDNTDEYDRYGPSAYCNTPCSGDSSTTCGGPSAISVWRID